MAAAVRVIPKTCITEPRQPAHVARSNKPATILTLFYHFHTSPVKMKAEQINPQTYTSKARNEQANIMQCVPINTEFMQQCFCSHKLHWLWPFVLCSYLNWLLLGQTILLPSVHWPRYLTETKRLFSLCKIVLDFFLCLCHLLTDLQWIFIGQIQSCDLNKCVLTEYCAQKQVPFPLLLCILLTSSSAAVAKTAACAQGWVKPVESNLVCVAIGNSVHQRIRSRACSPYTHMRLILFDLDLEERDKASFNTNQVDAIVSGCTSNYSQNEISDLMVTISRDCGYLGKMIKLKLLWKYKKSVSIRICSLLRLLTLITLNYICQICCERHVILI